MNRSRRDMPVVKRHALQDFENTGVTPDEVSAALGITTRTLYRLLENPDRFLVGQVKRLKGFVSPDTYKLMAL